MALLGYLTFFNQIFAFTEQAGTWQEMDRVLFCNGNTQVGPTSEFVRSKEKGFGKKI